MDRRVFLFLHLDKELLHGTTLFLVLLLLFPVTHNQAQGLMIISFGSTGAWPPCHQQEDKVESDDEANWVVHIWVIMYQHGVLLSSLPKKTPGCAAPCECDLTQFMTKTCPLSQSILLLRTHIVMLPSLLVIY